MNDRPTTDDLIRQLAAQPVPPAFNPLSAAGSMVVLVLLALGLFLFAFDLRADLAPALGQVQVLAKTALPLVLSVAALWLGLRSSRPEGQVALWPLALPAGVALLMVLTRLATADGPLLPELVGKTASACLVSISVLSVPPLAVGVYLLRGAAPVRPVLTGALLGIAVGAGIAAGYALHCAEDSPLFFVTWYGLGIAIAGGMGGFLGNRFLRW